MSCPECAQAREKRHHPVYLAQCLDCCVRLVLTGHPHRKLAGQLAAGLERFRNAPARSEIVRAVEWALNDEEKTGGSIEREPGRANRVCCRADRATDAAAERRRPA